MALWRLYYHLVWGTKNRLPLIIPDIESDLHDYIIGKADALKCIIHAIGGIENHVHIVVSIPPKLSVSDFLGHLKGSSSHHINHEIRGYEKKFAWQRGYGVFSLGAKQLGEAVTYVINQKQRHNEGNIIPVLERIEEDDQGPRIYGNINLPDEKVAEFQEHYGFDCF